jgi:hypothetical protein
LFSLYGLFGDQNNIDNDKDRTTIINQLFSQVYGKGKPSPQFEKLSGAHIEIFLPEILKYRKYLYKTFFENDVFHLYPDIKEKIKRKKEDSEEKLNIKQKKLKWDNNFDPKKMKSLEGNTNLDALITGEAKKRNIYIFIEAKFLSDISKDIEYVPVRNQIARNIDAAIDITTEGGENLEGLQDFWFVLLTPGIFRTDKYGIPIESPIAHFIPEQSRLYCYKMDDYLDPTVLRKDLPHWDKKNKNSEGVLDDSHWEAISKRIGWLTFEDIVAKVLSNEKLKNELIKDGLLKSFVEFFRNRDLFPKSITDHY